MTVGATAESAPAMPPVTPAEQPRMRADRVPAGPPAGPPGPPAAVRRLRVVACCVALTALSFQQRPGLLAPDTKLDLVADPGAFLRRALGLWEPTAAFGQLQNQSYGYLFPMGPFFWLGRAMGLPAWAVQRLWLSLLLCLAFTGVVKLAGLLRIGGHAARLLAGAAFALSPGTLTVLGSISAEALPVALAPWVLVPLVAGARDGSPRRWAALSGLAVLAAGGVNAAATLAVLPLPALWLLCLPRGPRRRSLAGWWALAVALATLWWVVPLLVLGRYSPPFLDYIETANITTARTSLVEVLRGTSHWVPFLSDVRGPLWPAGHALLTQPALVLDTLLVAGLGLVGLLSRSLPRRRWLLLGLLCGVAAVCFGHVGPADGILADQQRRLLDGALAPLRNVHKYDMVLRLPLILAGAHLATRVARRLDRRDARAPDRWPDRRPWRAASVYAAVGAAVLGVAAPAFAGILVPRGSFAALPGYWREAAGWLRENGGGGRALLVPGSSFADYYWGRPGDEPLQPLARSPWAVRNAIPLTPPETIRMLDAVQQRLADGRPSAGLAPYLARAGVRYLVVRNDLDYAAAQSARPLLVHQAVVESPGLELAATFGPKIGGGNRPGLLVDQDLDIPLPAVEVFEVRPDGSSGRDDPRLATFPLSDAVRVAGGPEALLDLTDRRWLAGRPAVLAGDGDGAVPDSAPLLVTDSPRRLEVQFGRLDEATSATLTRDEPNRLNGPASDYLWRGAAGRLVVAEFVGARAVRASSARSYPDSYGATLPENQPFAAVDSASATSWRSDPMRRAVGAWWEVELATPRDLDRVRFRLDTSAAGPTVTAVRVSVDAGTVTHPIAQPAALQEVSLPDGPTRRLRITVAAVQGGDRLGSVGLRDVVIPGVRVSRTLVIPPAPASAGAPILAFSAAERRRDSCFRFVDGSLCATGVRAQSEDRTGLDRTITLPGPVSYDVSLVARPQAEPR
jgi:arabinofuranan 3-O-arabinosyltransferase